MKKLNSLMQQEKFQEFLMFAIGAAIIAAVVVFA